MARQGSQWDLSRLSDGEWCTPYASDGGVSDIGVDYDTDGDCGPDRDRHHGYFIFMGQIYSLEDDREVSDIGEDEEEDSDEDPPPFEEEDSDEGPPPSAEEVGDVWWRQPHVFDMSWLDAPVLGVEAPEEAADSSYEEERPRRLRPQRGYEYRPSAALQRRAAALERREAAQARRRQLVREKRAAKPSPFSDGKAVPDEYECPICTQGADGEVEKGHPVVLKCPCRDKAYHMACISGWRNAQSLNGRPPTCPLCRSRIR